MAEPGDMVTVHEGIYREWVNPAHGGKSELERITYRAADGEKAVIPSQKLAFLQYEFYDATKQFIDMKEEIETK